jgi:hypothetical protein
MCLPGEIRNMIWRTVVPTEATYQYQSKEEDLHPTGKHPGSIRVATEPPNLGLLLACKMTFAEASTPHTRRIVEVLQFSVLALLTDLKSLKHSSITEFRILGEELVRDGHSFDIRQPKICLALATKGLRTFYQAVSFGDLVSIRSLPPSKGIRLVRAEFKIEVGLPRTEVGYVTLWPSWDDLDTEMEAVEVQISQENWRRLNEA